MPQYRILSGTIYYPETASVSFDEEFPIAPAVTNLQVRWNAPAEGEILAIYVWADDAVPATSGTYTISASKGGSSIFSGFDLTGITLATQTSVGTLTNNYLASGDEVEFTIASNNADLTGAGMRLQIVFRAVGTPPQVDGAVSSAEADVPIAPNTSIEVRFTIPVASRILAAKVIADDTIPSSAAGTYTVALAKDPAGTNVNLLSSATEDLDGTLTLGSHTNLSLTAVSADLDVAANNTVQFKFVSDNVDLVGAGLRCILVTQANPTDVAVNPTHIVQRGVTIAPNSTIDIRFNIPVAAVITAIGVIADDTQPSSAAGTYELTAVKDPAGTNTNLLNSATYDLNGTLTAGVLANPTLTTTAADLEVAANTTLQISFASDNADLVGAGLRCMVVYREASGTAAISSAGMDLLFETTLTSSEASVTTGTLATGYRDLMIFVSGRSDAAGINDDLLVQFNADSTAGNYEGRRHLTGDATADADISGGYAGNICGTSASALRVNSNVIHVLNHENTTFYKAYSSKSGNISTSAFRVQQEFSNIWLDSSAITSVQFRLGSGGDFLAGSTFSVYGVK